MVSNASAIKGYAITAMDGPVGTVSDFLFDDASWRVRWLVVNDGPWLGGRGVLLPTAVLDHIDEDLRALSVRLTKKQVEDSPGVTTAEPVSRQMETSLFDYYGTTPYWSTGFYMGGFAYLNDVMTPSPDLRSRHDEENAADRHRHAGDPHLRSINAVTGYHVQATDGAIGHVQDFLLRQDDWTIRYLVIDTRNWWPGRKVLISPSTTRAIDWAERRVDLTIDRQRVKNSPVYETSARVDRAFEDHFHQYYSDDFVEDHPPTDAVIPQAVAPATPMLD